MKSRIFTALGISLLATHAWAANQSDATATLHPQNQQEKAVMSKSASVPAPATVAKITVDKEKVSYGIGVDLGESFKAKGIEIDPSMIARGIKDATAGGALLYSQQELASTLMEFQKQVMAKSEAELKSAAAKNLQEGNAFLAANKTKPGVITTASGLQYKVIDAGKGNSPTDKDIATVDYSGTLPDGKVFDSSYQRGKPATFPVGEVIPGWTEALKLMKPGATFEVYVPANLAYGVRGINGPIGPNQVLIFKIHLISIAPQKS